MSHKLKEAISITLVLLLTGLVLFSQQYWQIDLSLEKSITNNDNFLVKTNEILKQINEYIDKEKNNLK